MLGPAYVGVTAEQVELPAGKSEYSVLTFRGELSTKKVKASHASPAAPKIAPLKKITGCAELAEGAVKWTPIDRPRDVDHLGVYYGYVWYRIEIEQDKAGDRTLFLPECEDRASIFVNGQFAGIWGREPVIDPKHHKGATRTGLKAHFARGTNVLTVLLDNLGRINFSTRLGELKGLYGHIYEAGELGVKPGKPRPVENSARRVVPRKLLHLVNGLESQQQYEIPLDLSLRKMAPVHLSFSRLPYGQAALVCNGRIVNFWEGNFGDQTLRSEVKKGRNEMSLVVWGKPPKPEDLEAIHLHELEADLTQEAKWSYRPWEMPGGKPLAAPAGARVVLGNLQAPSRPDSLRRRTAAVRQDLRRGQGPDLHQQPQCRAILDYRPAGILLPARMLAGREQRAQALRRARRKAADRSGVSPARTVHRMSH